MWNDPELNIPWPLDGDPVLSGKDAACTKSLNDFDSPFDYKTLQEAA
jgi:hypothetical protein